MEIITRAQWGARHEDGGGSAPLPAKEWWLHHSVTIAPDLVPPFDDDDAAIRTLEAIGEQRFGRGISYTWAITPVGRVYVGHSMNRLGAHTGGRNSIARAICFVGNYDTARPTAAQIEAAAQLLVQEYRAGRSTRYTLNGGHQQAPGASTACPGRYGMAAIGVINARAAAILGGATPLPTVQEDDDMAFGDNERRVLQEIANGTGALISVAGRPIEAEQRMTAKLDALIALQQQELAAGDQIDVDAIVSRVSKGVTESVTATLLAAVGDVVRAELGADNADQADAIVERIADRLSA